VFALVTTMVRESKSPSLILERVLSEIVLIVYNGHSVISFTNLSSIACRSFVLVYFSIKTTIFII
jgi:hypothetical protein